MFAGQVIEGGWLSLTVTVNWHEPLFPDVSLAVQVTVVEPFAKADPDAGEQTTDTPGQLSVAAGAL